MIRAVRDKKGSGFFLFEKAALRRRDEQCIWSRQAEYSWTQTYQQVCQYGHYFQQHGVKPGHYVGMYFYNSPDFMFIWLGLLSIGAAPALINFNLASSALLHCVEVSGTQLLLYDSAEDCVSRIERSKNQLHAVGVECVVLDAALKAKISQYPISRPETDCFNSASFQLPLALMYTRCVDLAIEQATRLINVILVVQRVSPKLHRGLPTGSTSQRRCYQDLLVNGLAWGAIERTFAFPCITALEGWQLWPT